MEERDVPTFVRHLRKRMGLTQEQFAQEVGVAFSTVNQWENGHRRPQPYLWRRLLEIEATCATDAPSGNKRRRGPRL